ncbi:MAG: hypothetical protein SX243_03805 [Acidobacteriota bacterium]|nr:hypothetical protein [Acidobacteriota bacterium]
MSETPPFDPRRIEVLDDDMVAILRAKTGAERLQIAFEMWESTCRMLTNMLSAEHPDWTAEEVQREVARRMARGEIP